MSAAGNGLVRESEFRWVLPRRGAMRVPGVIFASEQLLPTAIGDRSVTQVENVATLPGIVRASYAMPDIHWGYGFPIGGVAATDVAAGGVISPGGVGFDISCGVRLLRSSLTLDRVRPHVDALMEELRRRVPAGLGGSGIWRLDRARLVTVLREGAVAAVQAGYGIPEDLERCEDGGVLPVEEVGEVSQRALERGLHELGSLGSGNHFLEVQTVERIFDRAVAERFGLRPHLVTVMIHTGSRGLGHQVCSDQVREMLAALPHYRIELPDPQLAAAPVDSPHGRRYLAVMAASANFGRANRQVITWGVRREFEAVFGAGDLSLVYDVSHNLAKIEEHELEGRRLRLCVHRKGATRALPAGHPDLPVLYRDVGQPVLIPGSMGTASYVLVGEPGNEAFASTCHGAGRTMSRHAAMRTVTGSELLSRLREQGIVVAARVPRALPEETPEAYKDIDEVVRVCAGAGLSRPVARLRPIGVLKG
ncbi:MAG TPA: RtcB family protein [Candidatus Dormibacteraeota bacterium]|jgi:tRNA-splicing ligase RtcB|nr:RtcB family protein [Candidatus Dormibacteraeota bacterium]